MSKPSVVKPIKGKANKQFHTPNSQSGIGDFYGSGVRNKVGKMRDGFGSVEVSKSKMKKPPKSLA